MHAVIVSVTITDPEAAESVLREQIVPRVSQAPEFVTGEVVPFVVEVRDGGPGVMVRR